jgi:UDP-2,3-diacylglucosamine pyrophosphatase LpxH
LQQIESHRTVWLSDIHLGTRACHVDFLIEFLRELRCDTLYLVGDVIDLEKLRRAVYWPPSHTEVLRLIMALTQQGTRVVYIPGNHDDDLRALAGRTIGGVEIARQAVHTTRLGKRLLVLHGDEFDSVIRCTTLTGFVGSIGYGLLLVVNRLVHALNALLGRPYWSVAQHVKTRLGTAVRYAENFKASCLAAARERRLDGVVCGHIHIADVSEHDGLTYCNDGDWVESCTALVEDHRGRLSLLRWPEARKAASAVEVPVRDAA